MYTLIIFFLLNLFALAIIVLTAGNNLWYQKSKIKTVEDLVIVGIIILDFCYFFFLLIASVVSA